MSLYSPQSPSFKQDDGSYISAGDVPLSPNRRGHYKKRLSTSEQLPTLHDVDMSAFQIPEPTPVDFQQSQGRYRFLGPFLTVYRAISGMLGFKEKYSLLCGMFAVLLNEVHLIQTMSRLRVWRGVVGILPCKGYDDRWKNKASAESPRKVSLCCNPSSRSSIVHRRLSLV